MVEVRYFAAVADLTGRASEKLDLTGDATVGDLRVVLVDKYGEGMNRLLSVAAYLVDDQLTRDATHPLSPRVDVLPPFAGG